MGKPACLFISALLLVAVLVWVGTRDWNADDPETRRIRAMLRNAAKPETYGQPPSVRLRPVVLEGTNAIRPLLILLARNKMSVQRRMALKFKTIFPGIERGMKPSADEQVASAAMIALAELGTNAASALPELDRMAQDPNCLAQNMASIAASLVRAKCAEATNIFMAPPRVRRF